MDSFNQNALKTVLAARHLTLKGVSDRAGVSESALRSQVENEAGPDAPTLKLLSKQLSVPDFVFFMDRPPNITEPLIDFRQSPPSAQPKHPSTVETIALAQRLQEVADDLGHADELPRGMSLETVASADFAKSLRAELGITDALQIDAENPAKFYALCRARVEAKGIFVLQDSFPSEDGSGFCLSSARLIVVNTYKQNHARRNFTLFHELAHLLAGRPGISDPFVTNNLIERRCNRFSGRFLCPRSLAEAAFKRVRPTSTPSTEDVYRCAKYLNISQEATVVRFEQLELFAPGSHATWKNAVSGNNPDWGKKRSGGGGNVAQEKVKLAKYGFTFASVFGSAVRRRALSPLQLYRISGLKPKYQSSYFDFASSAESVDADDE
jgi:Zn-dependent peptidase ImmA (M78 family)/transcriptional regulator with XRE-family HTH domain